MNDPHLRLQMLREQYPWAQAPTRSPMRQDQRAPWMLVMCREHSRAVYRGVTLPDHRPTLLIDRGRRQAACNLPVGLARCLVRRAFCFPGTA